MNNTLRKILKITWWLATPWQMPARLRHLRARQLFSVQQAQVEALIDRERQRIGSGAEQRESGAGSGAPFNLMDDSDVLRQSGLRADQIFWAPENPAKISNMWAAARYVIDLLRRQPGLRARFPLALSEGATGAFARWIEEEHARIAGMNHVALAHVLGVLTNNPAARARQAFLVQEEIRSQFPHGLTPVGMRVLFTWFMWHGRRTCALRSEEVWWLFLDASEQPRRELWRAYLFTPRWQKRFPDGLTVFGRDRFANWFATTFDANGAWLDTSTWPAPEEAVMQLRAGYWARDEWRRTHPRAFSDLDGARQFVLWLATPEAGLAPVASRWCKGLDPEDVARQLVLPGVNVIGHFCYPSGLRVSVESIVEALDTAAIATSLRDVRTDAQDDPDHVDFDGLELYDFTLIHVQPEPLFDIAYRRADIYERVPRAYRIAYWYWEFDSAPAAWLEQAGTVDEVWAATEFVGKGLRDLLSVPVRVIFPGVKLAPFERRDRSYFGLAEKPFTFLFCFHMMSIMERKNPLGLIRAFYAAFPTERDVRLVLKTSFGDRHPAEFERLREAVIDERVVLIDAVYTPDEVLSLIDTCDAYVSLHRSEGLGLTMAEAMLLGKPVVATNFSGNVDFMDETNSMPVRYELVELGVSIPPYDSSLKWAEPSVSHAAECMRRLYVEPEFARELGNRAKLTAENRLSLNISGQKMAARLSEIKSRFSQ